MRYVAAIVAIALAGCGTGFRGRCDEGHPAVAHARSFSKDQLADLYDEIFRLRDDAFRAADDGRVPLPVLVEYGSLGGPIPESLQFLNAVRVRPYGPGPRRQPIITLAGCFDEYVYLAFYDAENGGPKIELQWSIGEEVLWSVP